ncbi:MAG: zinc ribbon domain-containing protein [Ruminococcus sp.]|nr:zinc ribbon domain-containing protein [Ruminococcus sp.]
MKIPKIKKEKAMHSKHSKTKYMLLLILNIIVLFFLVTMLLTCMTLRYYIKSFAVPKAIAKMIVEDIKIEQSDGYETSIAEYLANELIQDEQVSAEDIEEMIQNGTFSDYIMLAVEQYNQYLAEGGELPELDENNLKYPIKILNNRLEDFIYKGKIGIVLRIAISIWIQIILAICILLLFISFIRVHRKENKKIGTCLKICSITAGIPCVIMFLFFMVLSWILKLTHLPSELVIALRGKNMMISSIGIGICIVIFGSGMLWNFIAKKYTPKSEMSIQEETSSKIKMPVPEISNRKFCRYCGKKLVNDNAQFCYQCGKTQ